jgi:hypothetical protein
MQFDGKLPSAALIGLSRAGVIDQNTPHHPRRDRKKVRAVSERDSIVLDKANVGLVHQGRGLKRVVGPLATQLRGRESFERSVDSVDKGLLGLGVTGTDPV